MIAPLIAIADQVNGLTDAHLCGIALGVGLAILGLVMIDASQSP